MVIASAGLPQLDFFHGRRVFLTGHTGFKGSWLSHLLLRAGAEVTGYALPTRTEPALFTLTGLEGKMHSIMGDVRDFGALKAAFDAAKPEIVIHMAAQPIVRESYRDPVGTYGTNVMGTVHILECIRQSGCVRSFLNVTTDKVYENRQESRGFRETDPLDGYDPYSNSKSCSELITHSYQRSFLAAQSTPVSTARAGNVIGGGDFSPDRIIPDCVRAVQAGIPIRIRNPDSRRPYQHVLDPLMAYLLIVQRQYEDPACAGWYNVGPEVSDCVPTRTLADLFCQAWGDGAAWEYVKNDGPHEDAVLTLDCGKIRSTLGWRPQWSIEQAVNHTVVWTKAWLAGEDASDCMDRQITAFLQEGNGKK